MTDYYRYTRIPAIGYYSPGPDWRIAPLILDVGNWLTDGCRSAGPLRLDGLDSSWTSNYRVIETFYWTFSFIENVVRHYMQRTRATRIPRPVGTVASIAIYNDPALGSRLRLSLPG